MTSFLLRFVKLCFLLSVNTWCSWYKHQLSKVFYPLFKSFLPPPTMFLPTNPQILSVYSNIFEQKKSFFKSYFRKSDICRFWTSEWGGGVKNFSKGVKNFSKESLLHSLLDDSQWKKHKKYKENNKLKLIIECNSSLKHQHFFQNEDWWQFWFWQIHKHDSKCPRVRKSCSIVLRFQRVWGTNKTKFLRQAQ